MSKVEYIAVTTGWGRHIPLSTPNYTVYVSKDGKVIQEIPTSIKADDGEGNATRAIHSILPALGKQGWELVAMSFSKEGWCVCRATLSRRVN